jgi:hypothetical protein
MLRAVFGEELDQSHGAVGSRAGERARVKVPHPNERSYNFLIVICPKHIYDPASIKTPSGARRQASETAPFRLTPA